MNSSICRSHPYIEIWLYYNTLTRQIQQTMERTYLPFKIEKSDMPILGFLERVRDNDLNFITIVVLVAEW